MISLSEAIPNALINMKRGMFFFTFGIATTIWLLLNDGEGATILIAVVLIALEVSSDTDLISAE